MFPCIEVFTKPSKNPVAIRGNGSAGVQVPADPFPLIATGFLEGLVKTSMQGNNGFGYDPMFYPKDSNVSLGEMDYDEKALLSHRGKAIQILTRKIKGFTSE